LIRLARVALVLLVLGAAPAAAQVRTAEPETITVSGIGKSSVVPDRVSFTVGLQTVGNTVEEATNQNNEKLAKVLAALKAAGAQQKHIQTSGFSIWPQQDHRQGALPRIIGYQVSNSLIVRTEKVVDAGRLLQAAVNAGANTSSGLHFEVTDPAKGRDEGLRAAFADAREKAGLLAQAAGRTLGRTLRITEGVQAAPPPIPLPRAAMRAEASVTEVPVASGTQDTTYTVSAVFELR
jgi:uncharacterized protein YggE